MKKGASLIDALHRHRREKTRFRNQPDWRKKPWRHRAMAGVTDAFQDVRCSRASRSELVTASQLQTSQCKAASALLQFGLLKVFDA